MKQTRTPGRTLAKQRRQLGLTQHELSHLTGLSLNRLVFFETDRIDLEPEELELIRKLFKARARETAQLVGA